MTGELGELGRWDPSGDETPWVPALQGAEGGKSCG